MRDDRVDVARGLAVVLMVQTHAYDGWVSSESKRSLAYAVTRALGATPAPLFLLLAGVGLAFGADSALRAGREVGRLRSTLALRSLRVVAWGYLVSLAYAVIEWSFDARSLLRADILHAIGLSLAIVALLCVGRPGAWGRAVAICIAAVVASVLLGAFVADRRMPMAAAVALALFVDVPGFTRFPVLPLVGFVAIGFALGGRLRARPPSVRDAAIGVVVCLAAAAVLSVATDAAVEAIGGRLSRAHPAVLLNLADGTARALAVVFLAYAATANLGLARAPLTLLGRHSLLAYAFHVPFCYGRLASPFAYRLGMWPATALVAALLALTWIAVRAREALATRS